MTRAGRDRADLPFKGTELMAPTPGHRELSPNEVERISAIRDAGLGFMEVLDLQTPGREISLARTKVEEAIMWAVKGVTD